MQYLTHSQLKSKISELERRLGVTFKDKQLLEIACVHSSYTNEHRDELGVDNERLEFLGDAVLELVSTEFLYKQFPDEGEGQLTSFRSALVKGRHLADIAGDLGLGEFLLLSHGEEKSGGRNKNYLLANMLESIIGALYLDQGFRVAHIFIDRLILGKLDTIVKQGLHVDAKSRFQEMVQEHVGVTPSYTVLEEAGPDHNKVFTVAALIGERVVGKGTGSSKQNAEQAAAVDALRKKEWRNAEMQE